jgi:Listeria-Bacteroides repeat domain (List_Bact_rpt).
MTGNKKLKIKLFSGIGIVLLLALIFTGPALASSNFLVIFMTDEDTVYLNKPVARYARVSEPEPPFKMGYIFAGWYEEPECINRFDFNTRIPAKTTLYAKWIPATDYSNGISDNYDELPTFKVPGFSLIAGIIAIAGMALILQKSRK